ncbi:MAG: radical SAM protein [Nanoarchaeota archaeon]|nr:radical SAM protein [Nanoarchaeota archaeon]
MSKIPILKGLERTEKEKREALGRNQPLLLSLYLDTACNLDCIFCFLDSKKSHRNEQLSLEEYKDLIQQSKELGVRSTLFFGAGEPLLDKKLFPLIEYSNELGLYSVMFTNASLVTREIAERIKDLDLSVVTSIKSRNPQTLEELTNVKGSAEKIYTGFQHLLDAGLNETKSTRLGVDILICKQVYDEVPELIRYCIDNNIYPMVESLLWRGRAINNHDRLELGDKQKQKLSERLRTEFPELAGERAYFDGSACDIDHYTLFVNYNGDVWHCFSRDIIAGNTRSERLEEIWNSPSLRNLREKSVDPSCDLCPGRRYNLEKCLHRK